MEKTETSLEGEKRSSLNKLQLERMKDSLNVLMSLVIIVIH